MRRQQQAVRAIESLRVGRMSPRLDVTGFEMPRLVDAGHSTGSLAQQHVRPERALAPSGPYQLFAECWRSCTRRVLEQRYRDERDRPDALRDPAAQDPVASRGTRDRMCCDTRSARTSQCAARPRGAGARRPSRPRHDAAVHACESARDRSRDSIAGIAAFRRRAGQHVCNARSWRRYVALRKKVGGDPNVRQLEPDRWLSGVHASIARLRRFAA